jgi:hypothetical protein
MGQMASNLGDKNVMDPNEATWGSLSGSEKGARAAGGAGKGLLQGFSNMQQQNSQMRQPGQAMPVPMPQQPQVDLSATIGKQRNPFYG